MPSTNFVSHLSGILIPICSPGLFFKKIFISADAGSQTIIKRGKKCPYKIMRQLQSLPLQSW
jgi:hypothetical protein